MKTIAKQLTTEINKAEDSGEKNAKKTSLKTHRYVMSMTDGKIDLVRQESGHKNCKKNRTETILMGLLPENLRETVESSIFKAFPDLADNSDNASVVIYGNLCSESIVYNFMDSLKSVKDLPDIIISYDFNKFYHNSFSRKFLNTQYFDPVCFSMRHSLSEISDPHGCIGIIAVDPWVIVIDRTKFEYSSWPREWYELLNPSLHKNIIFSGGNDYFNRSVFFPFIRNYGNEAVNQLSGNLLREIHPSLTVNLINENIDMGASVFVMPYSYARQIHNDQNFQTIWPEDGAIAIPIQVMVKKGAYEKHRKLIEFLTGSRLGKILEGHNYVSVLPDMPQKHLGNNLKWIGWDFIAASNISKLKDYINLSLFGQ